MKTLMNLLLIWVILACGSCSIDLLPLKEKNQYSNCTNQIPSDLSNKISQAYGRNIINRNEAIASERQRLQVEPLNLSEIFMDGYQGNFHLPEFDPYPNSIVAVGDPYDIREKGYQVNHGKMDMTYVYETEPGSEQYFIVDMVGGDGIGGNSQSVIAENTEYQSLNLVFEESKSWHSWHVNENNVLVRANQNPTDNLKEEINLCGCGRRNEVYEAADDLRNPIYSIGIFLLQGKSLPSFMDENEFTATFEREYYKKNYVPAKGKKCEDYQCVC